MLTTVRYVGTFLADPLDVPTMVVDYLADQLGIADPSCVKQYLERRSTRFEHAEEIKTANGLRNFGSAEAELEAWVDARAWTTGDGPKAIFTDATVWLREHEVLLPGVSTLTRLVARVRDAATARLWDTLSCLTTEEQRRMLGSLLVVPAGARVSDLERWRQGPSRASGPSMIKALDRVAQIRGLGFSGLGVEGVVPRRRLVELARYGMAGKATALERHPEPRKIATLLATVVHLEATATDDALDLLDLLLSTELVGKAKREADKATVRRHPQLAKASAQLAAAMGVLFEATAGNEHMDLRDIWAAIDAIVSRPQLRAALATVTEMLPPPDAVDFSDWRKDLTGRIVTVSGFLKILPDVITFGANPEAVAVLDALGDLPALLSSRKKPTVNDIHAGVVTGPWKRLVFGESPIPDGSIDRSAYVFCVLEQFHHHLRRRDVYAAASDRWRDPQADLLAGAEWVGVKDTVLIALGLPDNPDALLAGHARELDEAYRQVGGRLVTNTAASVDHQGKLHVASLKAVPEPPSLVDLRRRTAAMMPLVELPELILEVMGWEPGFEEAFTALSGGTSRLKDLRVTIAAALTAHSLNIGFTPITKKGIESLERDRISHVDQNYLRAQTYAAANATLIGAQARIPFATALGGGLVAAVDGMRFVVPVPSLFARPNRKYFGPKRGMTWLNMINNQAAGLGSKVVASTPKDSLHAIDVFFGQDGGPTPEVFVTDTGSYSDLTFGLVHLLGKQYRPALADLPDQKLWRISTDADYGPLNTAARGKIDLAKVRRHWPGILRVVGSIYTGTVRAYDMVKMLQRDGSPTPLGDAIAAYGRIFKSLHVLTYLDDEVYRGSLENSELSVR